MTLYDTYLKAVQGTHTKLVRAEFIRADGTVSFSVGGTRARGYGGSKKSEMWIEDGSVTAIYQNGTRRSGSISFAGDTGAFDFDVNNIWFGQMVRLSAGIVLPDGTEYPLPLGTFYLTSPKVEWTPTGRKVTYDLIDKWAMLDGTLGGNLDRAFTVNRTTAENQNGVFDAMRSLLLLSRYDMRTTETNPSRMIDPVTPVFTKYYNGKTYTLSDGSTASVLDVPYDVTVGADGGTVADLLNELNTVVVGIIGYDATGALRVDPSQESVDDTDKPILWSFTPENSMLLGVSETYRDADVYNDVIVTGEGMTGYEVWGEAKNFDPKSDTNVNIIGRKTLRMNKPEYWNSEQCTALARWELKRRTVLSRSVSVKCAQLFHLREGDLITIKRTDKTGSPIEKHIIQSFTLPLADTGEMTITATSVTDAPQITTVTGD